MGRLRAGDRVGGYAVEFPIGVGSRAEVYRAREIATGRLVALKVPKIDDGVAWSPTRVTAWAGLCSPRIVSVEEQGECRGVPFLALVIAYHLTGGPAAWIMWLSIAFLVTRLSHLVYMYKFDGLHPLRAIGTFGSHGVNVVLVVLLLIGYAA